jgi:predicted amidohydrolase YtcJ
LENNPLFVNPDGPAEGYSGYPTIPNDDNSIKIDEQALRTLKPLTEQYGNEDRRLVLIHGQYVGDDKLDVYKALYIITSLFPVNTFNWGDWYSQINGSELGQPILPV